MSQLSFRCPTAFALMTACLLAGATAHADITLHMIVTSDPTSETPEVSKGVTFIAPDRMAQRLEGTESGDGKAADKPTEKPAGKAAPKAAPKAAAKADDTAEDEDETDVIFRADRDLMWFVNHGRKSYRQIDRAAVEAFAAKMNQAMAKMKAQMAALPPEQRAAIEKNLGGMMSGMAAAPAPAPKVEYRKTADTKTISGFDCTKYERVADGKVEELLWVAPNAATGFTADDIAVFAKMGEFMEKLLAAMGPAVGERVGDEFAAVSKLGGWPILTQTLDEHGKVEHEVLVESIAHDKLADPVFEVPQGYTQETAGLPQD
jgi:hypothetical protein